MVADNPDQKIELKTFHCEILNDHDTLRKEEDGYQNIPVIRKLDDRIFQKNYEQIRKDMQDLVQAELEKLLNDPELVHLVLRK